MMSIRRSMFMLVLPLAVAGASGCGGSATSADPVEGAGEALAAQSPEAHPPGPPGPELLLFAALHELDLTAAQKTTISAAIEASRPSGPPPGANVFAALAEGVRKGNVDVAAIVAQADQKPDAARVAKVASSLKTLHDTLTKDQRRTLVEAVASRAGGPGRPPGPAGGPLGALVARLGVSDAQRGAIDRALAANRPDEAAMTQKMDAMHAEMKTRLDAFAADSFDATAFAAPPPGDGPKEHVTHMVKDIAAIVPILDATQRATLASLLEKGPPGPPPHG